MTDTDTQTTPTTLPRLWNPNAAALWSLVFTPAFGAYLHAANWRTLGKPNRALVNFAWVWATALYLALVAGTMYFADSERVERATGLAGMALLFGWYITQGQKQAAYVRHDLRGKYIKKTWKRPLRWAAGGVGAYVIALGVIAVAVDTPDPADVAIEVRPLILQELRKSPERQDASVQTVSLVHERGNRYTGFVVATVGTEVKRYSLKVTTDGDTLVWELTPLTSTQGPPADEMQVLDVAPQ